MERPSKEQVDAAMDIASRHPSRAANTLAAEVRALRAECVRLTAHGHTIGVGDGAGALFIHGSYEAMSRVQAAFDTVKQLKVERAELRDALEGERAKSALLSATATKLEVYAQQLEAKLAHRDAEEAEEARLRVTAFQQQAATLARVEALCAKPHQKWVAQGDLRDALKGEP